MLDKQVLLLVARVGRGWVGISTRVCSITSMDLDLQNILQVEKKVLCGLL